MKLIKLLMQKNEKNEYVELFKKYHYFVAIYAIVKWFIIQSTTYKSVNNRLVQPNITLAISLEIATSELKNDKTF